MTRLRIGVIGAGLVAQVEHIPNILRLRDKYALVGVADPSAKVRTFVAERFGVPVRPDLDGLLRVGADAIVVATPDSFHKDIVIEALSAGLHVFCEKPLCYSVADAASIQQARDRAGRIVQVGYMKRFDPSYEAALELLPEGGKGLRYISVEVHDPDAWPFTAHHPHARGNDVAAALAEEGQRLQRQQVKDAVGKDLRGSDLRGFANAYFSALVHDVNAVHGMLERMGIPDGTVTGGQWFAGGDGGSGTVRLLDGQAVWQMVHLTVPSLADYRERIGLYFDDALVELVFPSPWLNHQPTRLEVRQSSAHRLERTLVREGFQEAFVREIEGFWSSIVEGTPVRNTVEHALRDQRLLCELAGFAIGVRSDG
ncbi:MAG: Gfo/Idh/MocA family protein [Kiloniellaceae bacterium]